MKDENRDLKERTKRFALKIIRLVASLPRAREELLLEADELVAIFTTIGKKSN